MNSIEKKLLATLMVTSSLCSSVVAHAQSDTDESPQREERGVEELVVTATRRSTSVLDVPYNVTAVSGTDLENSGITDLSRFGRMVPGLAYVDPGPRVAGNNNGFIIRGLNATGTRGLDVAQFAAPTVSTYLGETPIFFNLKTTDLQRIEVLRGPQGTLYGSGSLGGTIRFIPKEPSTDAFFAEATMSKSITAESDGSNSEMTGVLNFPLSDRAALRFSGGYESLSGFIDQTNLATFDASGAAVIDGPILDPGTSIVRRREEDTNSSELWHLRAALKIELNESAHLNLHYNYQNTKIDDRQSDNPFFPGNEEFDASNRLLMPLESDVSVIGMDVEIDVGFATLTSATSYYDVEVESVQDDSGFYDVNLGAYYFGYPRFVVGADNSVEETAFVQELRLTSNGGGAFDWLVGAFYMKQDRYHRSIDTEDVGLTQFVAALDPFVAYYAVPTPSIALPSFVNEVTTEFEDMAIFGELTFHISDVWQVTGGVRAFSQEFSGDLLTALPICFELWGGAGGGGCGVAPDGRIVGSNSTSISDQVFKLNTSYSINDNTKAYFTWSQGFRRGGANAVPISGPFAVSSDSLFYEADENNNYELGIKGRVQDRSLRYSIALYHIDWDNIQFDGFVTGGFNAVLNGGSAQSQGVEIELDGVIGDKIDYRLGYGYSNSELTEDFAIVGGTSGDRDDPLPGAPSHTFSFGANYVQPLSGQDLEIVYHVNASYKGETVSAFNDADVSFFKMEGHSIVDASISLTSDLWSVGLYANNLLDERAVSGGTTISRFGDQAYFLVNRPRTVGVRLTLRTG